MRSARLPRWGVGATLVALTVAGCASLAARSQPAAATFPGSDGRIILSTLVEVGAEGNEVCLDPPCSGSVLRAIDSHTGRRVSFSASRCDLRCEDRAPEVSPDGRRIAFERVLPTRPPGASTATTVALTDGAGSRVRQILTDASDPVWSPNGTALAVVRLDGIHLIRPDGRRLRRLTTVVGSDLDWSVRGQIIFSRRVAGRFSLYAMRANGTPAAPAQPRGLV